MTIPRVVLALNDKTDKVVEKLFKLLLIRLRGSDFIFDFVHLLFHKSHKINTNCGGSELDFTDWIKNNISINNKDNKYFLCTVTVASNHEQIKKDLQKITKIKIFIDKYNWEGLHYPSEKDDWK